jgi:hypothetical protein
MKHLYLLSDIIDFPTNELDIQYAAVNNNFNLAGTLIDLAFSNTEEPFEDERFYTIPLIFTTLNRSQTRDIASMCEDMHTLDTRFTRYLVSTPDNASQILVEASGSIRTNFPEYAKIKSEDLKLRVDGFEDNLIVLNQEYQATALAEYPA